MISNNAFSILNDNSGSLIPIFSGGLSGLTSKPANPFGLGLEKESQRPLNVKSESVNGADMIIKNLSLIAAGILITLFLSR